MRNRRHNPLPVDLCIFIVYVLYIRDFVISDNANICVVGDPQAFLTIFFLYDCDNMIKPAYLLTEKIFYVLLSLWSANI